MNPFENEDENNIESVMTTDQIIIWKENRGRKINTYIVGWNLEIEELKHHLKLFKQQKGCNGSVKIEDDRPKLQFQGDKVDDFIQFMKSKGIDENIITVKGQ